MNRQDAEDAKGGGGVLVPKLQLGNERKGETQLRRQTQM